MPPANGTTGTDKLIHKHGIEYHFFQIQYFFVNFFLDELKNTSYPSLPIRSLPIALRER